MADWDEVVEEEGEMVLMCGGGFWILVDGGFLLKTLLLGLCTPVLLGGLGPPDEGPGT